MYLRTLFFSSYETIISIVFGLLTIFIVYKIVNKTFLKKMDVDQALKSGNFAIAIFSGTIVLSTLLLVQTSILPSVEAMRTMVLTKAKITFSIVGISLLYFLLFYAVALVISIVIILLAIAIYMKATTQVDEIAEISENNYSIAVILSLVILAITLFIKAPVKRFISSLINYDAIESSYVNKNNKPALPQPQPEVRDKINKNKENKENLNE